MRINQEPWIGNASCVMSSSRNSSRRTLIRSYKEEVGGSSPSAPTAQSCQPSPADSTVSCLSSQRAWVRDTW